MTKIAIGRRVLLSGTAAAAGVAALAAPGIIAHAAPAKTVVKIGTDFPVEHPGSVRLQQAAPKVAERSKGLLEMRVFPSGQLGSDTDMFSQIRSGASEMMLLSGNILSVMLPVAGIYNVPFAFLDYEHLWAAMDGGLGDYLRAKLDTLGLFALSKHWDNGFREITSSDRTINGPEDLNGFKIRVPVSPIWLSLFKALGASPTAINWSEVYTALQTHLVDGQENALPLIESGKLYEVQKHVAITNHMWDGPFTLANKRFWQRLAPDLQHVLTETLNEQAMAERGDIVEQTKQLQAKLTEQGMVFNQPNGQAFRTALVKAGFYAEWKKTYGDEAWGMLEKYCGKLG
jgi:TRAP-type transport system periplasmic protein